MTGINISAIIIHVIKIIQGGENKCEITKELVLIGNLTDDRSAKRSKREILESLSTGSETRKKLKSMAWMPKYS